MLDIKYIKKNKEEVVHSCKSREKDVDVDKIIDIYSKIHPMQKEVEKLRHEKNKLTDDVKVKKKAKKNADKEIEELQKKNSTLKEKEESLETLKKEYKMLMYKVPNILDKRVPLGNEDKVEFEGGKKPEYTFKAKTNWEIFEEYDLADFPRGIKAAGDRGWVLKGLGAQLLKAILAYCTDFWRKKGYFEIIPPYFVNEENLYITGHYPGGEDEVYRTEDGKVFVATAEISVLAIYANDLFQYKDLPLKIMAHTPCFRREAGTHSDDKGLYRTHQFEKLELTHIGDKKQVSQLYEEIFEDMKELYEELEVPYRMITLRANDMAGKAMIERDMELWMAAENRWGEVGSIGMTGEFQSRRGNMRYEKSGERYYVDTTYATGCVPHRIMIAILNNNQKDDGSIDIPKVLHKYLGGITKIEKNKR